MLCKLPEGRAQASWELHTLIRGGAELGHLPSWRETMEPMVRGR